MVAPGGDRQSEFGYLFASNVDGVQIKQGVALINLFESALDRFDFQGSTNQRCGFAKISDGYHFDMLDHGCFLSVRDGDQKPFDTVLFAAATAIAAACLTPCIWPSTDSSPTSISTVIGKSKLAACLGSSAGTRLMPIRS
jgi:hypothetical protein